MDTVSIEEVWRTLRNLKHGTPLSEFPFPLENHSSDLYSMGDGVFVHDLHVSGMRCPLQVYWAPGLLVAKRLARIIPNGPPKMPKKAFQLPPPSIIDSALESWDYGKVYTRARRLKVKLFEYASYGNGNLPAFQFKQVFWPPFFIFYSSRRRDWKTETPIGLRLKLEA